MFLYCKAHRDSSNKGTRLSESQRGWKCESIKQITYGLSNFFRYGLPRLLGRFSFTVKVVDPTWDTCSFCWCYQKTQRRSLKSCGECLAPRTASTTTGVNQHLLGGSNQLKSLASHLKQKFRGWEQAYDISCCKKLCHICPRFTKVSIKELYGT